MIILYEKDATTFNDNGICVLSPSSCVVDEVAGGEYELTMEHPLDDNKKYMMLTEERLIKAPVPKTIIPETTLPSLTVYKVSNTNGTNLYSKVTRKTNKNKNWQTIQAVKNAGYSNYYYSSQKWYNPGALAVFGTDLGVYRCKVGCFQQSPTNTYFWVRLGSINDAAPTINTGTTVIEELPYNETLYKIAVSGDYIQVRTYTSGRIGFVLLSDVHDEETQHEEVLEERTITEQVFRIYATACDESENIYTVKAKHISYDFMSNCLYDCKVTEATPAEAIAFIQGSLIDNDSRKIACDITEKKVSQDWSFKNPINALLDPDSGLLNKLNAKLVRDNADFFILDSANNRKGITIEYGVNMLGVSWTRSIENTVTKVIPRCGSSDKGYKYISDGGLIVNGAVRNDSKNYVESSLQDPTRADGKAYQVDRIMVLECSYTEGQEYEEPDGSKKTYSEADVLNKMKSDALEKFTKDKIDGEDITLDVQFLLLGDTEEYKQYKGLQWVSLYDIITIKTGKSGINAEVQVTEYEFDCLRLRYNSIKLGKINSFNKRIAGYRFINGSITYEKLSSDLIDRITTANASSTTNSDSAGSTPTGGGDVVSVDVYDGLDSYSASSALSANQGRVLKGMAALSGDMFYVDGNSSVTKSLTANVSILVGVYGARVFMYVLQNSGTYTPEIIADTYITISHSDTSITITNSGTMTFRCHIISL